MLRGRERLLLSERECWLILGVVEVLVVDCHPFDLAQGG